MLSYALPGIRARRLCSALVVTLLGTALSAPLSAAPSVVVSIAPVHALVAQVMAAKGSPVLLMPAGSSPHGHALRPSQRRNMGSADLLIWMGADLEPGLRKAVRDLPTSVRVIELLSEPRINRLSARRAGVFAEHVAPEPAVRVTGTSGEANSDDSEHRSVEHDDEAHRHSVEGDAAHAHGARDAHVWLDPDNAIVIVELAAEALSGIDPPSAPQYRQNARELIAQIGLLDAQIKSQLAPVREQPWAVFHDAYQSFEAHYGLNMVAALATSSAAMPGTRRLLEVREHLRRTGVRCVFGEPQLPARQLDTLTEGLDVRRGVLDPLGSRVSANSTTNLWITLMRDLADSLHACLSGK